MKKKEMMKKDRKMHFQLSNQQPITVNELIQKNSVPNADGLSGNHLSDSLQHQASGQGSNFDDYVVPAIRGSGDGGIGAQEIFEGNNVRIIAEELTEENLAIAEPFI